MKKFKFASLRGEDFVSYGETPEIAWANLCEREKDNGNLWKCFDDLRNAYAVQNQGFTRLGNLAYKEDV